MIIYSIQNMIPFKDLYKKKCAAQYMNISCTTILGLSESMYERLRIHGSIKQAEEYTIKVCDEDNEVFFNIPKTCFKGVRK